MTIDFARRVRGILEFAAEAGPGAALRLPDVVRAGGLLFAAMAAVSLAAPRLAAGLAVAGAMLLAAAWVARFVPGRLRDRAKDKAAEGRPRPHSGGILLGTSLPSGLPVRLTAEECRENLIVSGRSPQRSRACLRIAADAIAAGAGVIYCDGRGDVSLYGRMYEIARRLGREDDLLVLNFMTSNTAAATEGGKLLSHTLNPFASGSADSLAQLVVSLMDDVGGDGAMWRGRAVALMTGVMAALVWMRDEGLVDLDVGVIRDNLHLKNIIGMTDAAKWPDMPSRVRDTVESYLNSLPGFVREKGPKQSQTTLDQHGYLQMQFTKILGSLADVYGHVFATSRSQVDMREVARNRRILVVMLPALEKSADEVANLGRIVVATLKAMMGSALGSGIDADASVGRTGPAPAPHPFTVIFDDFTYYCVTGMRAMAGLSEPADVCFVFGCDAVEHATYTTRQDEREARAVLGEVGWRLEFVPDADDAVLTHKGKVEIVRPAPAPEDPASDLFIRVNHTI